MAELETFRAETRTWLEENAPASLRGSRSTAIDGVWGGKKAVWDNPDEKLWLDRMAEKGWTAPEWPTEYGGGGLSREEAKVLDQEMRSLEVPPALIGFGLEMIGPVLLRYGTEDQKKRHLTKICRGEIRWCQGYSEPGAGSDLASVQMKGVLEGDTYIVNGQKIWTSYADLSDWIFCLVRTEPDKSKHEGISFILIDMDQPGVSVKPILLISGKSPFCETFFEDAKASTADVVHEVGAGWTVAKALLGHERGMIAGIFGTGGGSGRSKGRGALVEAAAAHLGEVDGRLADPVKRDRIVQCEMDTRALSLTVQRSSDGAKAGHHPGPETSLFKVYGTEFNQRRTELVTDILGPNALGWEGPGFVQAEIDATRDWLRARGNTIEGGTSEVQLNIIAKRVLGLPD